MKFFKKFSVAVVITALVVVGCIAYSSATAPARLPDVKVGNWVCDQADVLDTDTESQVRDYNSRFDSNYSAYVAVVTVDSMKGWDPTEFGSEVFEKWELYGNDFLLVLNVGEKEDYLFHGSNYTNFDYDAYLNSYVDPAFFGGDYDTAVLSLMEAMDSYLAERNAGNSTSVTNGTGWAEDSYNYGGGYSDGDSMISNLILLIIVLVIVLNLVDRARYNSWHRRYGGMHQPPVRFVPIFFWNRSPWWLNRRPPRGPGPGGRPPRSGGGFGGFSGGFGGHSGGGFGGGGGHGGGFGGFGGGGGHGGGGFGGGGHGGGHH